MKQAIGNLLSNAIKYSTDTKKIFIRLFKKPEHVCIEVEDRGIGIPEDKLSRIFEQFYRIEQKESISGTGLGLTVVKEIIEAHNGTISVTSEIGKGSKFTVTIPLAEFKVCSLQSVRISIRGSRISQSFSDSPQSTTEDWRLFLITMQINMNENNPGN